MNPRENETSASSEQFEESDVTRTSTDTEAQASPLSEAVSNVVHQVHEHVAPALNHTKDQAGQLAGEARNKAATSLNAQKDQAADGLGAVADVLRQTGEKLREADQGPLPQYAAQYGEAAAAQVERASQFLHQKDVSQLLRETESFARREPALFLGGAFLLGILGARLLKTATSSEVSAAADAPEEAHPYSLATREGAGSSSPADSFGTPARDLWTSGGEGI